MNISTSRKSVYILLACNLLCGLALPNTLNAAEYVYWTGWAQPLRRTPVTAPGTPVDTVVSTVYGRTIAVNNGQIYWIDDNVGVRRMNLDGANTQTILPHPSGYRYISGLGFDPILGKLYTPMIPSNEPDPYLIRIANLDGSNLTSGSALWQASSIAVDHSANKVCWALNFTGSLVWETYCAQLSLLNRQLLTSNITSDVVGMAANPDNGRIYFTQADRIQRIKYDGTQQETVLNSSQMFGLAFDSARQKMYWVENHHFIKRANLDGSNVELFFDTSLVGDNSIEALTVGEGPEPAQAPPVPAVSIWGSACLTLGLLIAGTHRIRIYTLAK